MEIKYSWLKDAWENGLIWPVKVPTFLSLIQAPTNWISMDSLWSVDITLFIKCFYSMVSWILTKRANARPFKRSLILSLSFSSGTVLSLSL